MPERTAVPTQLARISHSRVQAVVFEELAGQLKLGRQVLCFRFVIDDQHAAQWRITALRLPFGAKHRHESVFKRRVPVCPGKQRVHGRAAFCVCTRQCRVEKRTARVGVDFNQAGHIVGNVKVVTHEHTRRPEVMPGDGRCVGQGVFTVSGQGDHALDGGHGARQHVSHGRVHEDSRV